jgi:hypothetical protein
LLAIYCRTGDAREQNVVDRSAQRAAERFHFVERKRFCPGDAFCNAGRSLEAGWRILTHQSELRDLARQRANLFRQGNGLSRVLPELGAVVEQRCAEPFGKVQRVGQWLNEITESVVAVGCALAFRRRSRERRRPAGRDIGHRKEHLYKRDTVRVAMVDADDHRAPACVVLDDVELPQRPRRIERRAGKPAYERLQLTLSCGAGKRHVDHVVIEIEFVGRLPECGRRRLHGPLQKAPETHEALGHNGLQRIHADRLREREHGADHHQVARTVHPQPCGVDRRNLVAPCHAELSSLCRGPNSGRLRVFSPSR